MTAEQRILLVEDEELIGEMVKLNLEREGYVVDWVADGAKAAPTLAAHAYDLIILDVMLPNRTGFEIARDVRKAELDAPILMLTARSETDAKVQGLDSGADDYLTKPFELAELLARARALIRRAQGRRALPSTRAVKIGRYAVNLDTREAETNEGPVVLSEKEAALLELFAKHPGRTIPRADILEEVWGMDAAPTERTVDNFIVRLRRLFERDPETPRHILTVRATGYRFEP
ncbi:MAG: DNA-binding response regulator [Myxococcales bacterium]|nr:MAG: DNA-binding response regulator [Myxococcales bacterium]